MKLVKQIIILAAIAVLFAAADIYIYLNCTSRLLQGNTERSGSSIEIFDYLPFDENSAIINVNDDISLTGELPVLDGAEGLYPVYSAFANAVYPESSVSFDGVDFTPESKLQMRNTLKAYKGVADGTADIIFCASPSKEQTEYAENAGAELEFVPIGKDAFVFLVTDDNTIDGLSSDDIRGVYSGEYKNWSELGGDNIPINPTQRLSGSGSQSAFLAFMEGRETVPSPDAWRGSPIGFSFRFYVTGMRENGGVKLLSLDGVYPDNESISSGEYPVSVDFYAVYDKRNDNPNIPLLIEWILSEKGQRIIEETGYVPIK